MYADSDPRRPAFVRERALSDEASLMRQEREKGRAEGLAEARAEGWAEGRAEAFQFVLSRLVESGMDEEQARRMLGL
jgi:flagellar biosynthesis/type III secretory pathway protein FliH